MKALRRRKNGTRQIKVINNDCSNCSCSSSTNIVGGHGGSTCDPSINCQTTGGSGVHPK
jgi:hypothetical protein